MKKKRIFLFSTIAIILIGAVFVKSVHHFKGRKTHHTHSSRFSVTEEKPFVVVIPSYNNGRYCQKNLQSVLMQNYKNFRIIYIDDASKDDTLKKVRDFIQRSGQQTRCTIIHNEINQGALANLYHVIHTCQQNEIIVILDGDDFFAHEEVLSKLNKTYANPNTWMTYGNFLDYPSYTQKPLSCKKIPESVIQNNSYRKKKWMTCHLKSFYAGLFHKIKLQDFLFEGHFFPMASDMAFMMPMLEMSGKHAVFVHDVLYLYNRTNPLNDHKINLSLQTACNQTVKKFPRYIRLKKLDFQSSSTDSKNTNVDMVIFSYDRPLQLYAFLESIERYAYNINEIFLIYRVSNEKFAKAYDDLQTTFPYVHCIRQSDQPEEDFQPILLNTLYEKSLSPYVVFSVDDVIVKDTINFKECIETMEKVGAYGFYLAHGNHLDYCYMKNLIQEIPPYIVVEQGINAWQFNQGKNDWIHPNSLDMVIYKKADIEKDFRKIRFKNPNILEYFWNLRSKLKRVGLFYDVSRCINIPLNKVNPSTNRSMEGFSPLELLDFFEKGLKINITPLHHIQNSSKHIDFSPEFIYRKDFVTESNFEELYQSAEINLHLGRAKVLTVEQL